MSDKAKNEEVKAGNQEGQELSNEQLEEASGGMVIVNTVPQDDASRTEELVDEEQSVTTGLEGEGLGTGLGAGKVSMQDFH